MRRWQLYARCKPREQDVQGEQPRCNQTGDSRRLPLAAAKTRGNPSPPTAAQRRQERGAELLPEGRAPPGALNHRRCLWPLGQETDGNSSGV